jgi:hypothetical protein
MDRRKWGGDVVKMYDSFLSPEVCKLTQDPSRPACSQTDLQTVPPIPSLFPDSLKLLNVSASLAPEVGKSYSFLKFSIKKGIEKGGVEGMMFFTLKV